MLNGHKIIKIYFKYLEKEKRNRKFVDLICCKCGNLFSRRIHIRIPDSCGCVLPKPLKELSGKIFGSLTLKKITRFKNDIPYYECFCICGEIDEFKASSITRSDGIRCCRKCSSRIMAEKTAEKNKTHGMSNTETYRIWFDMKRRCYEPKNKSYKNYGGKGIRVCESWQSFEGFYKDMGIRPEGKSLDRIDNSKNYEKSNCRWADVYEQANNRSNNHVLFLNGEKTTMALASRKLGIDYRKLEWQLKIGRDINDIAQSK